MKGRYLDVTNTTTFDDVKSLVISTLGIENRADSLQPSTVLLGGVPEFDSMAVVELVAKMEEHFGIQISDDEITGEVFETFGSVAAFVDARRG